MREPNLINDAEFMEKLRSLTSEVTKNELEKYFHCDHIPMIHEASRRLGVFVLSRRANPESIKFVGSPGFVPKPLACKAKTAVTDARLRLTRGEITSRCAGLVVDPKMTGATAFDNDSNRYAVAVREWEKYWGSGVPAGFRVQSVPDSGFYGCVMRCGSDGRVFPHSRTVGGRLAAQHTQTETLEQSGPAGFLLFPDKYSDAISTLPNGCAYIHGDYDLYALVHKDNLAVREVHESEIDGVSHSYGPYWRRFEALVRIRINLDMIQHGSHEHFGDHLDEPVYMFCPVEDRSLWHVKVPNAKAMERVYTELFGGRKPYQQKALNPATATR